MKLTLTALAAALLLSGSTLAYAADQYFFRVPAPAKCAAANCSLNIVPGNGSAPTSPPVTPPTPSEPAAQAKVALSAYSLSFDPQLVGTSSSKALTLSNPGNAALALSPFTVEGNGFALTSDCGSSLAASQSCQIQVGFTPTVVGNSIGNLFIGNSVQNLSVPIQGSGLSNNPVTLVPASGGTDLGGGIVGSGGARFFNFTNNGTQAITGVYATTSGTDVALSPLAMQNTCGTVSAPKTLAAGATCRVNVRYNRTTPGPMVGGAITLNSSGNPTSATLALSGYAIASIAEMTPTTDQDFGTLLTSEPSRTKSFTLRNTSTTASLDVTGVSLGFSTTFGQNNNCGTSLGPGASCTISVMMSPNTRIGYSETYLYVSTAQGSVLDKSYGVLLKGTTLMEGDYFTLSPSAYGTSNFGNQPINVTPTSTLYFNVSNYGTTTLSVQNYSVTGADAGSFNFVNTCGSSLASGQTCRVEVQFAPKSLATNGTNTHTATLNLSVNNSVYPFYLTGTSQ